MLDRLFPNQQVLEVAILPPGVPVDQQHAQRPVHQFDGECLGITTAASLLGGMLLILPILGLFYLPWCSKFAEDGYFIELAELDSASDDAP